MERQGDEYRGDQGYNPPTGTVQPPPPQNQQQQPAAPAAPAGGGWDADWEGRARRKLEAAGYDLSNKKFDSPEDRAWMNKKLRKNRQGQKSPEAPAPGGAGAGSAPPPMQTGGPEPMPGPGEMPPPTFPPMPPPGPQNPTGGWMPNRSALPWGGGGRTNWGQEAASSQGYPGGGAGYPGAPNYPMPGQQFPLPGYPGGSVRQIPGQQFPQMAGGYPMPPGGRGYPPPSWAGGSWPTIPQRPNPYGYYGYSPWNGAQVDPMMAYNAQMTREVR